MARKIRDVKTSIPGRISRDKVKKALNSVHVVHSSSPRIRSGGDRWVVTKVGEGTVAKKFASKVSAIQYAKSVAKTNKSSVFIHPGNDLSKSSRVSSSKLYKVALSDNSKAKIRR